MRELQKDREVGLVALAEVLWHEGDVGDPVIIAAAVLHDTVEDTETTPVELLGAFGALVAEVVEEVTDANFLSKRGRKRLQIARTRWSSERAKQVKLADKVCNLRNILASPPKGWSIERKREYFDWAKRVVDQVRDANPKLERRFDLLYRARHCGKGHESAK